MPNVKLMQVRIHFKCIYERVWSVICVAEQKTNTLCRFSYHSLQKYEVAHCGHGRNIKKVKQQDVLLLIPFPILHCIFFMTLFLCTHLTFLRVSFDSGVFLLYYAQMEKCDRGRPYFTSFTAKWTSATGSNRGFVVQ